MAARTNAVSADEATMAQACLYMGFSFRETAGSTATIQIYDNASAASGVLLDTISLAANESAREWYGPQGIRAANGVYCDVTGTVEGSVRIQ